MCYNFQERSTPFKERMKTLSIREMRRTLGSLDTAVIESGEIVITRRGKPIARLLPIAGHKPKPSHARLRQKMARLKEPSERLTAADRGDR